MYDDRIKQLQTILEELLTQPKVEITGPSVFPYVPGIYVFSVKDAGDGEFLRAGKTEILQQRIYQNHLMGNQQGNLPMQLVKAAICKDIKEAKVWIRTHCVVQFLEIRDPNLRSWAEHFMLAILRPKFMD